MHLDALPLQTHKILQTIVSHIAIILYKAGMSLATTITSFNQNPPFRLRCNAMCPMR